MQTPVMHDNNLKFLSKKWPIRSIFNCLINRLSLSVLINTTTLKNVHSTAQNQSILSHPNHAESFHSFDCAKRLCLLNLCRLIINLDVNMYLSAAERVFYTISDQHDNDDDLDREHDHNHHVDRRQYNESASSLSLAASTSQLSMSKLTNDWIFWHEITRKSLNYPERLRVWEYSILNSNEVIKNKGNNNNNNIKDKHERKFYFLLVFTNF
ncbi:unnamed protein product [Schistosoma turkestanicum]|nr:unnamed protein product [Schistosoma turkestanicum]